MKRFLTITILTLSCLCGCVFAGELRRDTKEETAVCLIESFGWSVDKQGSTELRRMSAHDFYAWYHHWIGKSGFRTNEIVSQEDVGKGNLAGMRAELYDETYDTVSDTEQVSLYLIPLEYDLPQDAALEAMIGFYQDKLCMTAIHIKVSWEIPNVPTPVIWSLDVGKDTVEKWKSEFLRFPHQVVS